MLIRRPDVSAIPLMCVCKSFGIRARKRFSNPGRFALLSAMSRHARLIGRILRRSSDAGIRFDQLCALLRALGFDETIRGSHHLFRHPAVAERINLQQADGKAKAYQVRQVRAILMTYGWDTLRARGKP